VLNLVKKAAKLLFIAIGSTVFLAFLAFLYIRIPHSPREALERSCNVDDAPDQAADSFILAGKEVVPFLIREIQDKNMPCRGPAIDALGYFGDPSAVAVLRQVLDDKSEHEVFRCSALGAIALIDKNLAGQVAGKYKGSSDQCLAHQSESILSGQPQYSRSYFEALLGTHD